MEELSPKQQEKSSQLHSSEGTPPPPSSEIPLTSSPSSSSSLDGPQDLSSLESDVNAAAQALDWFFENKISECMEILKEKSDHGLYHSLGASAAQFIYSVLTFDRTDMNTARDTIHRAIDISGRKRKGTSFTEFFWGSDVNDYTDEEIHAELCYAENHIMLGFLTFAQDPSIFALIKAAYRIKVGNDTYKTCTEILTRKKEWQNENLRKHFESGVCTGVGTANLILSHLPSRALKVLRFAGFGGDRETALQNLKAAATIKDGLRFKVVCLITISYNLYMEQFYGLGRGDLQWAVDLIDELHQQFPNGVIVLTFLGRLKQLNGETDRAIECFQEAIQVPIEWPSIRNICYWEQIWCYAVKGNWAEAAKIAKLLRTKSHWSRCVMTTLVATLSYMNMVYNNVPEIREEVVSEMRNIPKLRRRIGGKTIPMEKLSLRISEKYFLQEESLVLPIYELFYFFNIYSHTGGRPQHLDPILSRIEEEITKLCPSTEPPTENVDNYALLLLLKGAALRYKKCLKQATECFLQIIQLQDKIQRDTYIPPHAALELGIIYVEQDKLADAKEWLDKARNDYKGFLVEVLVHMRIHAAQREITDREKLLQVKESESSEILDGAATTSKKKTSSSFGVWIKSFV